MSENPMQSSDIQIREEGWKRNFLKALSHYSWGCWPMYNQKKGSKLHISRKSNSERKWGTVRVDKMTRDENLQNFFMKIMKLSGGEYRMNLCYFFSLYMPYVSIISTRVVEITYGKPSICITYWVRMRTSSPDNTEKLIQNQRCMIWNSSLIRSNLFGLPLYGSSST